MSRDDIIFEARDCGIRCVKYPSACNATSGLNFLIRAIRAGTDVGVMM